MQGDCCSYWGEALVWGPNNKVPSAEQCCSQCAEYKPASEDDMACNGEQSSTDAIARVACEACLAMRVVLPSSVGVVRR